VGKGAEGARRDGMPEALMPQIKILRKDGFGSHYLTDEGDDENPLVFEAFKDALVFLDQRNYTLAEILELDFETEVV
jgi:hypothetical protein